MSTPALPSIIASMRADGSRLVLTPADVHGRWIRLRRLAFAVLIAVYAAGPFIPFRGHPAIQLDVQHRKFYLLGGTFNAQDFWMVLLLALAFAFGLLLVTAWRGRVWCGWACPQTVFLEGVYRPIERFIDGPRERRLKQAQGPWTLGRVARFAVKQLAFFVVSVLIAHTATALFVSPRELWLMITEGPQAHMEAFLLTTGFTAILVFNFAWFREQFCVVLCPYGRLQSVLHDQDSITVAYDEKRGEPRGHLVKAPAAAAARGDCIDCSKCVTACPTGIDIRSGLQMECIACHQCIDACDEVMRKVKKPEGLIRFMSVQEQAGHPRRVLRPRLFVYAAIMLLSLVTLTVSLLVRTPFEANVLRPRGSSPWMVDGEVIRNAFEVHLINKGPESSRFHITATSPVPATIFVGTPDVEVGSLLDTRVPVSVSIDSSALTAPVDVKLTISDSASGQQKEQLVRFLAPLTRR